MFVCMCVWWQSPTNALAWSKSFSRAAFGLVLATVQSPAAVKTDSGRDAAVTERLSLK